ncbi:MAG: hypothetical protein KDA94_09825 [Acidimicrobiales bacterium]|nr:hypothetical protein [Acidimicrobiales bacterium]
MEPAADPETDATEAVPLRARSWLLPIVLAAIVVALVFGIGRGLASIRAERSAKTVTFVVPDGTAERSLTEVVEIMPERVELNVGDTLVIRNDDTETATVGPFTVRPGETVRQHFQQAQTLIGECSLSGSGTVQIVVT